MRTGVSESGRRKALPTLAAVAMIGATLGCGDGVVRPDWTVRIQAATTGADPDLDGYDVIVDDGATVQFVAPNGSATFELAEGHHSIHLTDLAENCVVRGANPVTVTTKAREFVTVKFDIVCQELPKP